MAYFLRAALTSHAGLVRGNHEDNFLFYGLSLRAENRALPHPLCRESATDTLHSFAVFDGMGGQACGEEAACAAARESFLALRGKRGISHEDLEQAVQSINLAVFRRGQELCAASMGTTLALLCLEGELGWVCNVGDSRIFLLRDGILHTLSRDHTDEEALRERGIRRKPRLTQYVGMDPEEIYVQPHILPVQISAGDRFLLCSDGVTDMLSGEAIRDVMSTAKSPEECVDLLQQWALAAGGRDNLTAIICWVE